MRVYEQDRHPEQSRRVTVSFPTDGSLAAPTVDEEDIEGDISPAQKRVAEHSLVHTAATPPTRSSPRLPKSKLRAPRKSRKARS